MPVQGQSISFSELNGQIGNPLTGQLSIAEAGVELIDYQGGEISICEFYDDGCPNNETYPFNVDAQQVDLDGNIVRVSWEEPDMAGFTITHYQIWVKADQGAWSTPFLITAPATVFIDGDTRPGYTHSYRVQAVGSTQVSPPTADMDNFGTTYPPTGVVTTTGTTPTTQ